MIPPCSFASRLLVETGVLLSSEPEYDFSILSTCSSTPTCTPRVSRTSSCHKYPPSHIAKTSRRHTTGIMSSLSETQAIPLAGDGAVDSVWRRQPGKSIATIFIHAGAGYHSMTNERVHLQACTEYVIPCQFNNQSTQLTRSIQCCPHWHELSQGWSNCYPGR